LVSNIQNKTLNLEMKPSLKPCYYYYNFNNI